MRLKMSTSTPKDVVIIGGSLGGLFTGVALKRLNKNLNIRIFERNPTPLLHDQGAGVVAGQEAQAFFRKHDRTKTSLTITSRQRLYLNRNGETIDREDKEQKMTSWDLLYHLLRANFDGVQSEYAEPPQLKANEGSMSYEYGCVVTDVQAPASSPADTIDFSQPVKLTIRKHSGEEEQTNADIVIAADGPSSTMRAKYFPDAKRKYAGYVAWRGTVPEDRVSEFATAVFKEKFTFYHTEGNQILAYLIPGHHGSLQPGKRLVNYVWYCNYEEESPEHVELMTDKDGKRHHVTLPPGGIQDSVWKKQQEHANKVLPPQFAELVQKTEVPFIQAITDAIAPSAVLSSGRVILLGDALANFRPHTAASTSQAAMDAMTLAEAFERVLEGGGLKALTDWEQEVVSYAKDVQRFGVQIGNRSQFGLHPLRG
ncbi:hypothetical protein BDV96DRAFT_566221 [Lophiotrema nucula]|uniref:2,6-dihydroxypyridine 3-monooxygenase substrate binding domain-containing protein n=1 Tax=Lophiotrema nucula TaxID=690887 RepID=A0A6A5ZN21_9PLEO|nr:hypothetical protein BDV96DRAFT_566221 [Lophiotrema nucula]